MTIRIISKVIDGELFNSFYINTDIGSFDKEEKEVAKRAVELWEGPFRDITTKKKKQKK